MYKAIAHHLSPGPAYCTSCVPFPQPAPLLYTEHDVNMLSKIALCGIEYPLSWFSLATMTMPPLSIL